MTALPNDTRTTTMTRRGDKPYADLLRDLENTSIALRVAAGRPMGEIDALMLEGSIDHLLDSIGEVTKKAPKVGDVIDAGEFHERPAANQERITVDFVLGDVVDGLMEQGFFDQFNEPARSRVIEAIESLDGESFTALHFPGSPALRIPSGWGPVGLIDLIARALQIAVTGNSETPWVRA